MKKKRIGIIIAAVAGAIVLIFLTGGWVMFGANIAAARTVEKLNENLYCMEYSGDYGFDAFLDRGGAANQKELASYLTDFLSHGFYDGDYESEENDYGCSTISGVTESGQRVFGRNYDWENCSAMIVHTIPDNGYESVSTACLDFLGFGEDWKPEGLMNQMMSLAAIYVPLDGMNEKGLVIADLMAGDKEETHQNTEKVNLTTTTALRLILDKAATVDEAIELLNQYDMNSDIGSAHHYAIADEAGKSVVVEYVDNQMIVTETPAVTNHYLSDCEKFGIGSEQSHDRYEQLRKILADSNGCLSEENIREALQKVSQGNYDNEYEITQWSIVYRQDVDSLGADFFWEENFQTPYRITLHNQQSPWIQK